MKETIIAFLVVWASFFTVQGMLYIFLGSKTLKSEKKITPEIELTINNNKVDTIYVYRKK